METHPLLGPPYTWCDDQCIPCPLSAHCPKRKRLGMVELLRESLDYPEGSEWLAEVWRVFEELCPEDRMPKVLAEREAAMGGEFCKAADALSDAASRVWDQAMKEDDLPWQIQSLCLACERFVEAVRLYLKNLEDAAAGREAVWGPVFLLGRLNRACEDAEMDALENAGRLTAKDYQRAVLYSTLSPCDMCSGTALLYKIPKVVIGENRTFQGPEDYVRSRGVEVTILDDPTCVQLMEEFIAARPELWNEDIGE